MENKLILQNRLKEVRTEKKISQAALADAVGVSRNTICSIEVGQYAPTAKLAYAICLVLDKTFEELFYFEGYTASGEKEEKPSSLTDKAMRRMKEYLSKKGWSADEILDFILFVANE